VDFERRLCHFTVLHSMFANSNMITEVRSDSGHDFGIVASIAVAADLGCVERSEGLFQFFECSWLLLPNAMIVLDVRCPPNQVGSNSVRRSTGNALVIDDVEVSWCRLWMSFESSCALHAVPCVQRTRVHRASRPPSSQEGSRLKAGKPGAAVNGSNRVSAKS
jgi:hypothetical protein